MTAKPKILTECFEDFSKRLDWRWERVQALFSDDQKPVTGFDDALTVRAFRFIKAFQDTETLSDRQLLRMKYPNELRAYDYYLNGDARRLKMEALCLCKDITQRDIAEMLDEDVEVVQLFEGFFFDIRSKKPAPLFNLLFPPGVFSSALGTNLADKVWKFVAVIGGFQYLKCFIDPSQLDESTNKFFADIGRRNMIKNFGIAQMVQPLEHRGDLDAISDKVIRLLELDIKEREAMGNALPEAQTAILQKCMEAISVQVMDPDYFIDGEVEPTVEDMLAQGSVANFPVSVVA